MDTIPAVILAAGCGRRMGKVGQQHAKALMPVGDTTIVGHQLRMLRDLDVREIVMVVGHRACDLRSYLGGSDGLGLSIRYIEQTAPLGIAHALGLTRSYISGPFLLLLGDYYFWAREPQRLLQRLAAGASAIAAKFEPDPRLISAACELTVDRVDRVTALCEKPVTPRGHLKGCGFYALQPVVFDSIAVTPRTALRDEYELTTSLDLMVRAGHLVYAEQIGLSDYNCTIPSDIVKCNLEWLRRAGRNEYIADDALVESDVQLTGVIVSDNAKVLHRANLSEVVVMAGSTVPEGRTLRRSLVTPDAIYGPLW